MHQLKRRGFVLAVGMVGSALTALAVSGCAQITEGVGENETSMAAEVVNDNPYPSTYRPWPSEPLLIINATVLDGRGEQIDNGQLLVVDGKIADIGQSLSAPDGVVIVDAQGKWLTPGIIDSHSHLGVYPNPATGAHQDGNEATSPNTSEVWAEHSVWPQDPGFGRALAGGVTGLNILPGSANLFGGRSVTLKNLPATTVQAMKFPGAPYGLKMACGENPKTVYGKKGGPSTRMGNFAGYRSTWIKAQEYKRSWDDFQDKAEGDPDAKPPKRDLKLDTLKGVLEGDIIVHMHCYQAEEMAFVIDLAEEFGYRVGTFHHALEAYKIAPLLAENDIGAAMFADWWGFKYEAFDGIPENIAFSHVAGVNAIVHSDSSREVQRLNQEAAKALRAGRRAGLKISKAEAWQWLSYNPAKSLGIHQQTGSLEIGKNADLVIWSRDPFSVYARAEKVYIDGAQAWDLHDASFQPVSDFELGQPGEGDQK